MKGVGVARKWLCCAPNQISDLVLILASGPRAQCSWSSTQSHPFQRAVGHRAYALQVTGKEMGSSRISIGPRPGATAEHRGDRKGNAVAYRGPLSSTIKKVKLLSLSTCGLSVSLGPVLTFMTGSGSNVILKGAIAASVMFFSASTTAALNWFAGPYVHKLDWEAGADHFQAETMSWLATSISRTINFSDVQRPDTNRPYVTFEANGHFYFVDPQHCHNKALLARLAAAPRSPANESPFKNL